MGPNKKTLEELIDELQDWGDTTREEAAKALGEIEDEHEQSSGDDGGHEYGQRNVTQRLPAVCAQHLSRVCDARIHVRPEISHHAQDDGGVVEDMRQQDSGEGVGNLDWRSGR